MSDSIDRRKVTKGLAWSVPTVVAAAAAPMAAASPTICNLEDLWRYRRPANSFVTSIDADGVITVTKPANWEGEWNPTVSVSYLDSGMSAIGELEGDVVTVTPPDGVGDPFDINQIVYSAEGAPTQTLARGYEADWEGRTTFLCEIESYTQPSAPSFCDTRDLWMTGIGMLGSHPTSIDEKGTITITKPEGWASPWPPNITVSYIGTDATATIEPDGDNKVIATPPAEVDPFDIERIESQSGDSSSSVYREIDWKGDYVCSLNSGGSGTS